ncbi:zf-TFIIB domain-containing protein [Dongia soli]|uniref:Zf-TFIIB domain-containing protein n=1 Tax=Dongia soli TaxID=600628 RepID=A0ABU5E915_9PROT|nr:zf-TFIIB domain-containing protein [Dongia soli]MDY0882412.1 zf-TFIIB domain-containing protein [Dongia soli]
MKCPTCQEDLVMSDRQGIEIDYCRKCRGVWLDRGELDKIIERSVQEMPQAASAMREPSRSQQSRRDDDDDYRYKHHRRKSWLSDLFD